MELKLALTHFWPHHHKLTFGDSTSEILNCSPHSEIEVNKVKKAKRRFLPLPLDLQYPKTSRCAAVKTTRQKGLPTVLPSDVIIAMLAFICFCAEWRNAQQSKVVYTALSQWSTLHCSLVNSLRLGRKAVKTNTKQNVLAFPNNVWDKQTRALP